MEHLPDYSEDDYYLLEGYEEDYYYFLEDDPDPEQGAAAAAGGGLYEGAQSPRDRANNLANLSHGGHMSSDYNLGPVGAQRFQQQQFQRYLREPVLPWPGLPSPQPRMRRTRFRFAQWQVQAMEAVFQATQYPNQFTRELLCRSMNVPEAKVKTWFGNRRARQRAMEKRAMLESMPPGAQDYIFMMDVEEP